MSAALSLTLPLPGPLPGPGIVRTLLAACPHTALPIGLAEGGGIQAALDRRVGEGTLVVEVVAGLCSRPEVLVEPLRRSGSKACLLVLCARRAALSEYRAWAARAGLDPFRVDATHPGLVPARDSGEPDLVRLAAQLAAMATRLSVPRPGPRARRQRPRPARVSRRALFALPVLPIAPVASIVADRCSAPRCAICLLACPTAAIVVGRGGRMSVATDRCDGCGVCVSACPADAVDLPGSSLVEHEAFLQELLRPSPDSESSVPPGIVFACTSDIDLRDVQAQPAAFPEDWSVVNVACVSMVTAGWILQAIASGVPAVALLPCTTPATLPLGMLLRDRVEFCQRLLSAVGIPDAERRVRLLPVDPAAATVELRGGHDARLTAARPRPSGGPVDLPDQVTLREPEATVAALRRLAPVPGPGMTVSGLASPLGRVRLDEFACTSCGACVLVCPTGALALRRDAHGSALVLDPGRCIPDGYCAAVCPEHALQMDPALDFAGLAHGPIVLKRNELVCRRCGAPCSEQAMVRLVRDLLPPGLGSYLDDAAELCAECVAGLMLEREAALVPPGDVIAVPPNPGTARAFAQVPVQPESLLRTAVL